jgi:hypothetical protein
MGAKYQTNSATGYNSNPPSDDGSQTAGNLVTWAKSKEKLGDPVKTLADDINSDLVAAFDYAVRQITTSDALVAGDHMRTVEIAPTATTGVTVTLADAATMTNIYRVYIKNSSAHTQTIARATGGDTIDGTAANISIPTKCGVVLTTNNAASGYLVAAAYGFALSGSTVTGNLSVSGNATLGDAVGDSHVMNGQLVLTDDGTAAIFIRSGGGDRLSLIPTAAGGGGQIVTANNAESDYEPLTLIGEDVRIFARTGVLTAAQIAQVTSTGLTVTGTIMSSVAGGGGFTARNATNNVDLIWAAEGGTTLIVSRDTDTNAAIPLRWVIGSTEVMRLSDTGLYINDTSNANQTIGLTINQGAADDEILSLKSSDVAHGMTSITETDTFGMFSKRVSATGGFGINGFSGDNAAGVFFAGYQVTANTTKATTSGSAVAISGNLKSGTSAGSLGANANILAVADLNTVRFILDADGDSHQDVGTAWTNFHGHNDLALLHDLSKAVTRPDDPIRHQFGEFLQYNREALQRARLVTFNEDGHHFVNMSKLTMALTGALLQVGEKLSAMEAKMLALESK